MALRTGQIHALAAYLDAYKGQRAGKIVQCGTDAFSFRLSRGAKVMLNLDNQNPCVYLAEEEPSGASLSTPISAYLRKRLSGAELSGVNQINGDRVLEFRFIGVNDIFQQERFSLILELIPTKANLIVVNDQGTIAFAWKAKALTDARPIFHGLVYEPPVKKGDFGNEEEPFDVQAYFASCADCSEKIAARQKSGAHAAFFRDLGARIKSLRRKIVQIEADVEKGKRHVDDNALGDLLLTYAEEIPAGAKSFDADGILIPLDPLKSAAGNASDYYKKAKKAKNAIALGNENLEKAKQELAEALALQEFANDALGQTLDDLLREKPVKGTKKVAKPKVNSSSRPLPYVAKYLGKTIYFGKTSKQNDALTFYYATRPGYLFLHPKDRVGAHVILPYDHVDNDLLSAGSQIALLASGLNDGEVQYAIHKSIRRGSHPGQVILGNYSSVTIRRIDEDVRRAYETSLSKEDRQ